MRTCLLDINLLLALTWPNHVHHRIALQWFRERAPSGWATCPLTETGFVRLSANPAFTAHALSATEAVTLLHRLIEQPGHVFWADDVPVPAALASGAAILTGHRQVTDAYLLALAVHRGGLLATLDRSVRHLARSGSPEEGAILFVDGRG